MALLPVEEALSRLLDGAGALSPERVPISDASGRVLAEPVKALRTQPPFDCSAMDGYAVRAMDVADVPVKLTLIGTAAAGRGFNGTVGEREAVRILTGAPLPASADTIIIQENARRIDDRAIEVLETVAKGRHIRRRALDFAEGDILLEAGRELDAGALSLAASGNHAELDVVSRPLVAIIATGDELLPPGSEPGPDQIIASNSYGVAAVAASVGARVLYLGIVRDDAAAIREKLAVAAEAGADVIVTLGGASIGDHDLVHQVLTGDGVQIDFWKIAMRPGKPLMFGRKGATRFMGMPGNPVASLICAHIFLKPLVARLGGRTVEHDIRRAVLGAPLQANDLRQDYVRARLDYVQADLTREEDTTLIATPFEVQDSSMLRTLAESRCLIIREPFASAAETGALCTVLILR
ncbi:molybdopterin molybdotransferase MoeA [Pseudaminobacter sp. 19-2017]|uniref:Molybdopterin molybdenumtransferase n=1 Tax=Pseudaminobacter soli (ex Zhang et al. 2022) TaxID=2831468 RepID=A0A942E005_9HYPH|nr:gephyrin-like molybdotransferase Glp [Pseudaminobacter soli]MBS3651339.1 molybdopterin molybdotransferase MoeA [Pseudaminobacter soli]